MKRRLSISAAILLAISAGALSAQTLSVDKTSVALFAQQGGAAVSQTLNLTSSASQIDWAAASTANWLKVNNAYNASGTTPSALTVTADPAGLNPGVYPGTLVVTGGQPPFPTVQVTLTVSTIGVSTQSLQFAYTIGSAAPAAQALVLTGPTTTYTAAASTTSGGNWLLLSQAAGSSPGTLSVALNPAILPSLAAGAYDGAITITPTSGPTATPITVQVALTVSPTPPVSANPAEISLAYQIGGTNNQVSQTLTLSTTGNQALSFGATSSVDFNPSGQNWIVLSPASGTLPANGSAQISVSYDSTKNLAASATTYKGKVTVAVPGGSPAQQDVPVQLFVSNSPLLSVPNATLNFRYELNGTVPAAQGVTATSTAVAPSSATGQMALTISAATTSGRKWLVVPATGTTGSATPISISVNPGNLSLGTYEGTVTVTGTGAGNGPQQIPVTLTVANDPLLQANAPALSFAYQISHALPASQTVNLTTTTGAPLDYSASAAMTTCGDSWLGLSGNTTGTTDNSFSVVVNPASLSAGTCNGTITILAADPATGNAVGPLTIPVTFYVSSDPLLIVNPATPLTFTTGVGGSAATQTITVGSTSSSGVLSYTVDFTSNSGGKWLIWGPHSGDTSPGNNTVSLSAQPGLLSAGTYTGTLRVTAAGQGGTAVANSPLTIPVTFQVTAATLSLNPGSLSFSQPLGGAAPAAQTITVATNGPALTYTAAANSGSANWLSVSPAAGAAPGTLTVAVDGSKLTQGVYQGMVTVSAATPDGKPVAGSPAEVVVNLTVAPTVSASPDTLTFTQIQGGTAPAAQTISVSGTGGVVGFSTTVATKGGGSWLSATPATGNTPGAVQVSANAGNLAPGTYTGTVTITSPGAIGSPIAVGVTLTVVAPSTLAASPAALNFTYVIGTAVPAAQAVNVTSSGAAQFTVATSTGSSWLKVTPTSGTAPAGLSVSVDPTGLAANSYTGTLTISSPSASKPVTVTVNLSVLAVPAPVVAAVKNAASWAPGAISPGENIVIGGTGLGPADLAQASLTSAGTFPTTLSETQVLFDGSIPAPIIYASAQQSSVMVPYEIAGRPTVTITVSYKGVKSVPVTYNVLAAAPGMYSLNAQGFGPGAILNQDYSVNGPGAPAAKDSVVALYMTGEGITQPGSITGAIAPTNGSGLYKPPMNVTATVGGVPATVEYYGSAPGIVYGVMQVNVRIPANVPSGPQPIVVTLGTQITVVSYSTQQGVTVTVQ